MYCCVTLSSNRVKTDLIFKPIANQRKINPSTSCCVTVSNLLPRIKISISTFNQKVKMRPLLQTRSIAVFLKPKKKYRHNIRASMPPTSRRRWFGNLEDQDREFVPVTRVVMEDVVQNEGSFPIPSPPTFFSTHSCPTRGIPVCLVGNFWGRYFHQDFGRNQINRPFLIRVRAFSGSCFINRASQLFP